MKDAFKWNADSKINYRRTYTLYTYNLYLYTLRREKKMIIYEKNKFSHILVFISAIFTFATFILATFRLNNKCLIGKIRFTNRWNNSNITTI